MSENTINAALRRLGFSKDQVTGHGPPTSGQPTSLDGAANESASQVAGTSPLSLPVTAGQDSFVFAPNFGKVTIANFTPATDTIQISQSIFANMTALLAATVITDAAHNTITIQHVTTAQLLAHQSRLLRRRPAC
jgi:hypothetical protein